MRKRIAELEFIIENHDHHPRETEKTIIVEDLEKVKELTGKVNRLIVEIESI